MLPVAHMSVYIIAMSLLIIAHLLQARSKRFNLLLLVRELGLNTRFMVPFFPRSGYLSANAGLEGGEEPSGKEVLRLIQIRLAPPSL